MLKSVLALSSLNVIGQIGVLAFVSISSWYLGSEQYGRYAVLVSLISIGAAVSTFD
jgi:O-antigen/teichoic acid export membrane protein